MDELFDGVVISGIVGIRKPAPEIYALGAERIGLPPEACVFVDDLPLQPQAGARAGHGDRPAHGRRADDRRSSRSCSA